MVNEELRWELEAVEREYRRLVTDAQCFDAAVSRAFRAAGLPGWEVPAPQPPSQPAPVAPAPPSSPVIEEPVEKEELADGFPVSATTKRTEVLAAAFCARLGGSPGDLLAELGSFKGKNGRVPGRRTALEYARRPQWLGVVHRKLLDAGLARGVFRVSGCEVYILDECGKCDRVLRADGVVDPLPLSVEGGTGNGSGNGRKPF